LQGFLGEFDIRFDDRKRVALPAKYRSHFADGVILAPGVDGCVEVHTPRSFEQRFATIIASSPDDETGRELRRNIYGGSWDAELDGQGRVVVPTSLREHGNLGDDLRLIGLGDYFELWNREVAAERKRQSQPQLPQMMRTLREGAR
jgi:MraZ protein